MTKIRTCITIAFAAVCFAVVWTSDQFIGFVRNALPGFVCVFGGYLLHLALSTNGWQSFLLAAVAVLFFSAALEFVSVRSRAVGVQRGTEIIVDGMVKIMQEQKRP